MFSMPPRNPYIAGKALDSQHGFFGRDDILHEVERILRRADDNAIVLYGQRRIGKTSILLQLQRRLPKPPFVPIYFDLMYRAGLPLNQVLYEMAAKAAAEVGLPAPPKVNFENNQEAFHQLFLTKLYQALSEEQRPVFLLDEFDVLDVPEQDLPETSAARAFRPYLYHLLTTERRLAFVFVVGRRMEELSAGFLANFKAASRLPVSVLRPEDARALILQAERDEVLHYEEAIVERILALTRGHPYLTQLTCQLLFDHAFDQSPDNLPLVTIADVEKIVSEVLDKGGHAFQWIWEGLPPAERIIFSAIATESQEKMVFSEGDITAVLQDAGIRILMRELNLAPQMLVNWQMLEQVNGGYRFFVELMRRWVAANWPLDKVKEELDRINPLADSLYQTAQNYHRQGNNERAKDQLRQALDANPNHFKARLLLGKILREEGQFAEAVEQFEKVHQLDEREGRFELLLTLLQQGEVLEKAGEDDQALVVYNRVLSISPNEQTAQTRRVALWEKRGDQALVRSDFGLAIEAYRQAGIDKKLAQVEAQQLKVELERLATEVETYEAQPDWIKAADVYQRLTQLDPNNEHWRQRLKQAEEELWLARQYAEGAGYVQQGEWDKAQKTLAAVISQRPDYQDAAELLAQAKRQSQGQPDQTQKLRRQLIWVAGGSIAFLLLAIVGVWGYSQTQSQAVVARLVTTATAAQATAITQLTATDAAQATNAEIDAATRVAVAIQGTQLAELRTIQTTEAQHTATAIVIATSQMKATLVYPDGPRRTATAEAQSTTAHEAAITQTVEAPTAIPTPTATSTSKGIFQPTQTSAPTATSVQLSAYNAPSNLQMDNLGVQETGGFYYKRVNSRFLRFTWNWEGNLKDKEFFELRIWQPDGPHWGGAPATKDKATEIAIDVLMGGTIVPTNREDLRLATHLCAGIAVITTDPYVSLSPESEPICWDFNPTIQP